MSDKLKPCPFCGDAAKIKMHKYLRRFASQDNPNEYYWRVECLSCGAGINAYFTEQEAIKAWNRRVNDGKA